MCNLCEGAVEVEGQEWLWQFPQVELEQPGHSVSGRLGEIDCLASIIHTLLHAYLQRGVRVAEYALQRQGYAAQAV